MKKWQILQKQEFDFLKNLKLPASYFKGKRTDVVMNEIYNEFNDQYIKEYKNDDDIFNVISEWDFIDWVRDNYNIKFTEEIRYYFE